SATNLRCAACCSHRLPSGRLMILWWDPCPASSQTVPRLPPARGCSSGNCAPKTEFKVLLRLLRHARSGRPLHGHSVHRAKGMAHLTIVDFVEAAQPWHAATLRAGAYDYAIAMVRSFSTVFQLRPVPGELSAFSMTALVSLDRPMPS